MTIRREFQNTIKWRDGRLWFRDIKQNSRVALPQFLSSISDASRGKLNTIEMGKIFLGRSAQIEINILDLEPFATSFDWLSCASFRRGSTSTL